MPSARACAAHKSFVLPRRMTTQLARIHAIDIHVYRSALTSVAASSMSFQSRPWMRQAWTDSTMENTAG